MTPTLENVTKAGQGLAMVRDDLRAALSSAGAVAGLRLLDLIRQASEIEQRCEALRRAIESDQQEHRP